ncbi:hypothetical protein BC629DRAFT_1467460 [Irpex lacteus]|nr:hypothetical protein BC629DRAFT_1467460 [Irpex lacteus]
MSDHLPSAALPTHPPAQKVAGRRMSMTSRPKPHLHSLEHRVTSADGDGDDEDEDAPIDYPRPAAPSGDSTQGEEQGRHYKNEQPKYDKKHNPTYGRKAQEALHKKADLTRPANDLTSGSSAPGVRVNQPSKRLSM